MSAQATLPPLHHAERICSIHGPGQDAPFHHRTQRKGAKDCELRLPKPAVKANLSFLTQLLSSCLETKDSFCFLTHITKSSRYLPWNALENSKASSLIQALLGFLFLLLDTVAVRAMQRLLQESGGRCAAGEDTALGKPKAASRS